MKNYRIQKVSYGDCVRYHPQKKILGLFWWNMFDWYEYYEGFKSYEKAKKELCDALKKPKVEYFDVDCE